VRRGGCSDGGEGCDGVGGGDLHDHAPADAAAEVAAGEVDPASGWMVRSACCCALTR